MPWRRPTGRSWSSFLPDLKYGEVVNLLLRFGTNLKGQGSPQLMVDGRDGPVAVHGHPSKGLYHAAVMRTVKRLGVTHEEFEAWLRGGKKRG